MKCKNCNTVFNGKTCPTCNTPAPKKKPYTSWWFWLMIGFAFILMIGIVQDVSDDSSEKPVQTTSTIQTVSVSDNTASAIASKYTKISIDDIFSCLESNPMRAESLYKNKYVEFDAIILSISSDGSVVMVRSYTDKNDTIRCYLEDTHKSFLMQKNEGDRVKIQGKMISVDDFFTCTMEVDTITNATN